MPGTGGRARREGTAEIIGAQPSEPGELSQAAESNLRRLCTIYLRGGYELELIDVVEQPEIAETERIVATPLAVRLSPPPRLQVTGDLSDYARVAIFLGLPEPEPSERWSE